MTDVWGWLLFCGLLSIAGSIRSLKFSIDSVKDEVREIRMRR